MKLFTESCLRRCVGFNFRAAKSQPKQRPLVQVLRWVRDKEAGTLPGALFGQMNLFHRVDDAQVFFTTFSITGHRRAEATLAWSVSGELRVPAKKGSGKKWRLGGRRADHGTVRVALRRSADGSWLIDAFDPSGLRTVLAPGSGFALRPIAGALGRRDALPAPPDRAALFADEGRGLSVADVDGDGDLDLFLPGPGLGRIWLGDGKGDFKPGPAIVTDATAGLGRRGHFGDVDGDGDPDLFVTARYGGASLLENQGEGRFVYRSKGLPPSARTARVAALLDANGDGRLDLLLLPGKVPTQTLWNKRWIDYTKPYSGQGRLLINRKRGFVDSPGLPPLPGSVTAACSGDLNGDGRTDLVVVDALGPVRILLNKGGRFELSAPIGPRILGRDCALSDLDGDGDLDVVIAAVSGRQAWKYAQPGFPIPGAPFKPVPGLRRALLQATKGSHYLQNLGGGRFQRRALASAASLGWDLTVAPTDLNGDGRPELLLGGGFHGATEAKQRAPRRRADDAQFFTVALPRQLAGKGWPALSSSRHALGRNRGATLLLATPKERVDAGGSLGLAVRSGIRAATWADLDRDGRPELLLRHVNGSLQRFETALRLNKGARFLTLRLLAPGNVRIGAVVRVSALDRKVTALVGDGSNGAPAGEIRVGLGSAPRADRVTIHWPDGSKQVIQDLPTGRAFTIFKGQSEPVPGLGAKRPAPRIQPRPLPPRPIPRPSHHAGIPTDGLAEVIVHPNPNQPQKLGRFFGKRATVLLFLPQPLTGFKGIRSYGNKLRRWARKTMRKRGVTAHILAHRRPAHLIHRIDFQLDPKPTSAAVTVRPSGQTRLLILDRNGTLKVLYLGKLPDPAVLTHHLKPLLSD